MLLVQYYVYHFAAARWHHNAFAEPCPWRFVAHRSATKIMNSRSTAIFRTRFFESAVPQAVMFDGLSEATAFLHKIEHTSV
jgi:hypothetical protein